VTDSIFVAGDIARAPHVLYEYQFLVLEHWDNAVFGGMVAAHNMVSLEPDRWPHLPLPAFWSGQFGVNIKGVGVGPFGDEIVITQGSVKDRRFAAAYGRKGRIVAASWPHRGRRHLQSRQVAALLRKTHRAIGAVPAPAAVLRSGRRHEANPSPIPGSSRSHGVSGRRLDRSRPNRTGRRVPVEKALTGGQPKREIAKPKT
jgi:hypothetical protein